MARFSNSPRRSRCWTWISTEPVFLLVDRLVVAPDARARIVDAIEISYRESGEVIFETAPRDDQPSATAAFFPALRMQAVQSPL